MVKYEVYCQDASPSMDGVTYFCTLVLGHDGPHSAPDLMLSWGGDEEE